MFLVNVYLCTKKTKLPLEISSLVNFERISRKRLTLRKSNYSFDLDIKTPKNSHLFPFKRKVVTIFECSKIQLP